MGRKGAHLLIIQTKYLGETKVSADKIITFEKGLPGFEEEKEFILLDISKDLVFQILQSVKSPQLAFFVVNPYYFYETYEFKLNDYTIESLDIKDAKEVLVLSVMTLKEPFNESTINLKAPLIINLKNRLGKQYILEEATYSMRAKIPVQKIESETE